jgi:hypothetical protein
MVVVTILLLFNGPYLMKMIGTLIALSFFHLLIGEIVAGDGGYSWGVFEPLEALNTLRSFDDTRLIDFDSGGGENPLWLADVTDVHTLVISASLTFTPPLIGLYSTELVVCVHE